MINFGALEGWIKISLLQIIHQASMVRPLANPPCLLLQDIKRISTTSSSGRHPEGYYRYGGKHNLGLQQWPLYSD
jgi:hypothetical protein